MSQVHKCQSCFEYGRHVGKLELEKEQLLTQLLEAQEVMARQETLIQSLQSQLGRSGLVVADVIAANGDDGVSPLRSSDFDSHQPAPSPNTQKKVVRHQSAGLASIHTRNRNSKKVIRHSSRTVEGSRSTVGSLGPPQRPTKSPVKPIHGAVALAAVEIDKEWVPGSVSSHADSRKPPTRTATPCDMKLPKSFRRVQQDQFGPPISEEEEQEWDGEKDKSRSLAPITPNSGHVRRRVTPTAAALVKSSRKKEQCKKPATMAVLEEHAEGEEDDGQKDEFVGKDDRNRPAVRYSPKDVSLPLEMHGEREKRKGTPDSDDDVALPSPPHLGSSPHRHRGFRSSIKAKSLPRELSLFQREEEERLSKSDEGTRQRMLAAKSSPTLFAESAPTLSTYSTSSGYDSEISLVA